ncbi:MAG: RluA family pseudouridine synthase [Deltaproteobacteria bacterium]|nr:MAG: RluA family pseudouridine synthase [Deltaproteobacteria bacterium]
MTSTRHAFTVRPEDAGLRLDKLLAARVPALSRRQARVLLDLGGVFVDGARVKVASRTLRPGQRVEAHIGGALARATKRVGRAARAADDGQLPPHRVVYEDDDVVVVDKPAGLLAAPTPEGDRGNLARLLGDVYVVHRIDLHTSGLLVYAKTRRANRVLSDAFRVHDVDRRYAAVVAGAFPESVRVLDGAVAGRPAVTHVDRRALLGAGEATALVLRLDTGRTHQIRVHCAAAGYPVAADPRYGGDRLGAPRLALHATRLGFAHPRTGRQLQFDSPLPDDLAQWLARRWGARDVFGL